MVSNALIDLRFLFGSSASAFHAFSQKAEKPAFRKFDASGERKRDISPMVNQRKASGPD